MTDERAPSGPVPPGSLPSGSLPSGDGPSDVTRLLQRWSHGDAAALDALLPLVHAELHRLAAGYMRRERDGHTLEPTALVNEAYLRLVDQRAVRWAGRGHFYAIAAQAMRRVLVDHARAHVAAKRGGHAERVTLSGVGLAADDAALDVIWMHDALDDLARLDARQAQVVEMRFYTGLSVEEVAEALGLSVATVKRETATARVWLAHRLVQGQARRPR